MFEIMCGYELVQCVSFYSSCSLYKPPVCIQLWVPQSAAGIYLHIYPPVCAYFDFCLTDEAGSWMLPEACSDLQLLFAQV